MIGTVWFVSQRTYRRMNRRYADFRNEIMGLRIMLRMVGTLTGSTIHATDGEIGRIEDGCFDDEVWAIYEIRLHDAHGRTGFGA